MVSSDRDVFERLTVANIVLFKTFFYSHHESFLLCGKNTFRSREIIRFFSHRRLLFQLFIQVRVTYLESSQRFKNPMRLEQRCRLS